jgi:predicted nucleic acid-binding protein
VTFWDSSALIPLVAEEARSRACRTLRRAHRAIAVWTMSHVEIVSGIHRLVRDHRLDEDGASEAIRRAERLLATVTVVEQIEPVQERALRLLGIHPLSAADALQLGAALLLVGDRPRHHTLVCADDRLVRAAKAEGFTVAVPRPA